MPSSGARIAVVGLGGLFPGARDPDGLWDLVRTGGEAAREVPSGRWPVEACAIHADGVAPDRVRTTRACLIDELPPVPDDSALPGDLLGSLDPCCRLGVIAARSAWEDAVTSSLDPARVKVVLGNIALPTASASELAAATLGEALGPALEAIAGAPVATTRAPRAHPLDRYVAGLPAGVVAAALGLRGGALALDAACASSLYALHLGVEELRAGRADAVIAGGLSRPDSLYTQMGFSQLRALSPSGRCAPFDAAADGLLVGEGCGLLVLKRLDDAARDGDRVHGVIAGIGLSNDLGANLMSPDSEGQLRAMRAAYADAGWAPEDVDLVECHGTGTPVGDATEIRSLHALRGDGARACVIGSVKSNIGHLLTAAGAAGLVKTLLAMRHETLPPTASFRIPVAGVDPERGPLRVLRAVEPWERVRGRPRRAAVSAFGFGGVNAHVLMEAPDPPPDPGPPPPAPARHRPLHDGVAITGLAASFGPWDGTDGVAGRLLGADRDLAPASPPGWFGHPSSAGTRGWFMPEVAVRAERFRIPPSEAAQTLPQQLLMLEVAARALENAGLDGTLPGAAAGVFVGVSLDLATTGYHVRWTAEPALRATLAASGLDPDAPDAARWRREARDAVHPALDANRTMGGLASIVASRIARAFGAGGPCFTLAGEECSGLRALEAAVRALEAGTIDVALVGAVDLAGDVRAVTGARAHRRYGEASLPFDPTSDGALPGEGAVALVLRRAADRDAPRAYAIVQGVGAAGGGTPGAALPDADAWHEAARRGLEDAGVDPADLDLVCAQASGDPGEDAREVDGAGRLAAGRGTRPLRLGSAAGALGLAGSASGLASVALAALSLHHRVLPGVPARTGRDTAGVLPEGVAIEHAPRPWLRDRAAGPRRAGVASSGVDGTCTWAVLEQADVATAPLPAPRAAGGALFAVEADDPQALAAEADRLRRLIGGRAGDDVHALARAWQAAHPPAPERRLALSVLAADPAELVRRVEEGITAVRACERRAHDGVWFSPRPVGADGAVAFVYPGSGNHFAGMGRDLAQAFPGVLASLDEENEHLASQFADGAFWDRDGLASVGAVEAILGHVWIGALVTDVLASLGLRPDAALGYSLGESSALFATRAWADRDGMLARMRSEVLFADQLAGRCEAARRSWGLSSGQPVEWQAGVVDRSASAVRAALAGRRWVYLLIVNAPGECVVGGHRQAVAGLVRDLGCSFHALEQITTVHCEVAREVESSYRRLHLLPTHPAPGVRYYSAAWGTAYEPTRERAADSMTAQAIAPFDFTRVVEAAWADGARIFVETGPGRSCARMVGRVLADRPHATEAVCVPGGDGLHGLARTLAMLVAERVPVDRSAWHAAVGPAARADDGRARERSVRVATGGGPFRIPSLPRSAEAGPLAAPPPATPLAEPPVTEPPASPTPPAPLRLDENVVRSAPVAGGSRELPGARAQRAHAAAHGAFLDLSRVIASTYARAAALEATRPGARKDAPQSVVLPPRSPPRSLDRGACLEFARGSIAAVLGPDYAEIDAFPTRVRLPDEPLMLVDRVLDVEGEPLSLGPGRVVTEHDVRARAWYLDAGRIPTCIAVEAGQADLFLSGWLGIDLRTRGRAVYRLLDAEVTFHAALPPAGATLRYDIRIEGFFRQGDTWLFRFRFDASVEGRPVLTMREGCAGFFTPEELDAGRGLVEKAAPPATGRAPRLPPLAPAGRGGLDEARVNALRAGDLAAAFGDSFRGLALEQPDRLPGGRMTLVHRVLDLDPTGGGHGLGTITAEADVRPDDWYLTCHFVDDRVMPGTLMYECCLHTLRILLMRRGWIAEADEVAWEPVPGVRSRLRCRGQVTAETRRVRYEVVVTELGYADGDGAPYALADARMLADGRPIVHMRDMSLRMSGLDRQRVESLWHARARRPAMPPIPFGKERILAFATGRPSDAFGDAYRRFDDSFVARLPGPPYDFVDRITAVENCEPLCLAPGGTVVAEYEVPPEAWYFAANRQPRMPYAVLLEVPLQACGWTCAWMGSAFSADVDLLFRNLGGRAVQHRQVHPGTGTLTTRLAVTGVSRSGGMLIERFDIEVTDREGPVLSGDTYFGFFTRAALAAQVGIRGERPWAPPPDAGRGLAPLAYPRAAPFPDERLRMVDDVEVWLPDGGPAGRGYLRATKRVDPQAWFFDAHFHEDPVWPGSLGVEAFLQLLRLHASRVLAAEARTDLVFRSLAEGVGNEWTYRGQILRSHEKVTVHAEVSDVDEASGVVRGNGWVERDGLLIYRLSDFAVGIEQ